MPDGNHASSVSSPSCGQPPAADSRVAMVRRAFEAWAEGTGSINDIMDDDTLVVIPGTSPHCGAYPKPRFIQQVATPFMARFSVKPVPLCHDLWWNDRAVVVTASATGTVRGGASYANDYVFIFEFDGARLARVVEYLDMTAFEMVWAKIDPDTDDGQ